MARQHGACEHLYLHGNCPFCEIVRLRGLLRDLQSERQWLADRLESIRVVHMATVAERDDALAQAEQERQRRIGLERERAA